jgi:HK97 family phage prohead protease
VEQTRLKELREFLPTIDQDLHRVFPFKIEEVRDSGAGEGQFTVVGHGAVFNRWSLDLGGFRERVSKGAFDNVLDRNPHVVHTWDHDTSKILSSTANKTLDLSITPKGLRYWSRVAPTSYAADLRVLLERGDINQSSFAFTVAKDEWRIMEDDQGTEYIERDILEVQDLFDVTTTAMGAYPTTDAALAVRSLLSKQPSATYVVNTTLGATATAGTSTASVRAMPVAPTREDDEPAAPEEDGEPEAEAEAPVEPEVAPVEDQEAARQALVQWKAEVAEEHRRMREYVNRVERE